MPAACDVPYGSLRIKPKDFPDPAEDAPLAPSRTEQAAVLAGGCFWCTEAVFKELKGVLGVRSGYAGGSADTADYHSVCGGDTGHAEVIEVKYDAAQTTFGQLLKIFFLVAHDPTQLNRQGNDTGTQYRSSIFYANDEQHRIAEHYIRQLTDAQAFVRPIATKLEPLKEFFEAEAYHQDYAARNPGQPYIAAVSTPKVEKLQALFAERMKR